MPPFTPPTASTALTNTNSAEAAIVAAANTAFIESTTVLILSVIPLGTIFSVQPPIADNVDYNVISTYFTGLGYTVTLTLPPPPFFGPGFVPMGFPEVLGGNTCWWNPLAPPPPYPSQGWANWQIYVQANHPRMIVSWAATP